LNHSFQKNGLCSSFAAYSSTFNQSITNSERGIFEDGTFQNIATFREEIEKRNHEGSQKTMLIACQIWF
jgi:hypothetical protein